MKSLLLLRAASVSLALTFAVFAPCAAVPAQGVEAQTRTFLDAYAAGDRAAVAPMLDDAVTVYGSDSAEVFQGPAAVDRMLADDQRLWGGAARIGALQHVSVAARGDLAAIFFDAPFTAAGRPPVLVRFALVWRRDGARWRLLQSSNTVPTHGQSAVELLSAPR